MTKTMKKNIIALIMTLMAIPFNLQAAESEITLVWDANGAAPYEYQVFRREAGQNYDYSDPVYAGVPSITNCSVSIPDDSKQYYFVARAAAQDNQQSANSNEVGYPDNSTTSDGRSVGGDGSDGGLLNSSCFIKALLPN